MIRGKADSYFTIGEVAKMSGVSAKTVRNWLVDGVIQAVRLGRRRFVPLSSLEEALGAVPRDPLPAGLERQLVVVQRDMRRRAPRVIRTVTKPRESAGNGGAPQEDT